MKKRIKWILLSLLVIILAAGGYALYLFKFKEYEVADPAVDEVVEDGYRITLPDGSEVTLDKEGNVINKSETAEKSEDSLSVEEKTAVDGKKSLETTQKSKTVKPTVAQIKDKYRASFDALESQANTKLSNLIGIAKSEYTSKKNNGESISLSYFYQKYMGAAKGLEANTDAAFYSLLAIVEDELQKNGYDNSYATSFEEEYLAAKKAREESLLNKIKSEL